MRSRQIINGVRVVSRDVLKVVRRQIRFHRTIPIVATLFLTYRCNSRCKTCTAWKRDQAEEIKKEINLEEWRMIVDKLHDEGVRAVEVFGGNVLLRKDLLIPLFEYLKKRGFTIHLPTNQIGLDDEIAGAIVRYADYVYISTDGVGNYQNAIRGQSDAADRSQNAIMRLLKLRSDKKGPRLICNTTVSKYNFMYLEQLVEYAAAMKFDEIHFEYVGEFSQEQVDRSIINGIRPEPNYIKGEESVLLNRQEAELLKRTISKIKRDYSHQSINIVTINIDMLSIKNLHQGTIPRGKCHVERTEVTVDPSGNVVVCPFITNYELGSLVSGSFGDIWNNVAHKMFRRHQNRGGLEMCAHCILGVQRNPGIVHSLQRIYFNRIQPALHN
jgi:MoaA/NifB/PqqE/SkfB family radical SAM enzyme